MHDFLLVGPVHPWRSSYIESQDLDDLLRTHNEMHYYLQECSYEDSIRSRVRVTASRIQGWLEENGAVMLTGGAGGGGNVNVQLSAPAPAPAQPQQEIIERQQAQPQMQIQQPAQQDIIYRQQALNPMPIAQQQPLLQPIQQNIIFRQQAPIQQSVVYQQQQQQPQLFTIPALAATLTLTSAPVQNLMIGQIGTPAIA